MTLALNFDDAERAAFDAAIAALESLVARKPPREHKRRGPRPRMPERALQMERLYRAGLTLEAIGTRFGVTRERVRQILKRRGVTYRDGGISMRTAERRAALTARKAVERAARMDPHCLAWLGCTHAEAVRMNGGCALWSPRSCVFFYLMRRRNARRDGDEWQLTFPEWCALWGDRWNQIGRSRDALVIARKESAGPFSFGNCYITTRAELSRTTMAKTIRAGRAHWQRGDSK